MAATYDASMPETKDFVRFLIQDTNVTAAKFQDEEIGAIINTEANAYMAAAMLCDMLVTKSGGVKYKKIGELGISYDPAFYVTLANRLRSRGSGHQMPYAGGISVGEKTTQQDDTTATQPSIFRNLDENHQANKPAIPPNNPLTTY